MWNSVEYVKMNDWLKKTSSRALRWWRRDENRLIVEFLVGGLLLIAWLCRRGALDFDKHVTLEAIATSGILIFTVWTLHEGRKELRARFIRDYISRFYTDKELFNAFYELIHNYEKDDFERVNHIFNRLAERKQPPADPTHEELKREVGRKGAFPRNMDVFYHPGNFQGTNLERRLDAVLGYLDVIGYYCDEGLIEPEDLRGLLGYYIEVLNRSLVIQYYFYLVVGRFSEFEKKENTSIPIKPFPYTRRLPEMIGLSPEFKLSFLQAMEPAKDGAIMKEN
jgi:hypothetical protein